MLLSDIRHWEDEDRRVQRAWARAYWGRMARAEGGDAGAKSSGENESDKEEE